MRKILEKLEKIWVAVFSVTYLRKKYGLSPLPQALDLILKEEQKIKSFLRFAPIAYRITPNIFAANFSKFLGAQCGL